MATAQAAIATRTSAYRRPGLVILVVGAVGALLIGVAASLGPFPGILALAAVPLGLLVLRRPDIGAYLLVALVPVLSGLRRGLPVPALRLSELLIAGIATAILLSVERDRQRPWRIFDWFALAYCAATFGLGLSQLLVRDQPLAPDVVGTLIGPFQFLLLYRAVMVALPEPAQYRRVIRLLILASVPVSLSALLQHYDLLGVRAQIPTLTGSDIDRDFPFQGGDRASGMFPHWQVLGGYAFWIVVLGVGALLTNPPILRRAVLLPVLALATAALMTTVTMTVILAALVGSVAMGIWYRRMDIVIPTVLIGGALAIAAFGGAFERRLDEQFTEAEDRPAWVPRTMDYRYRVWRDQYVPVFTGSRYFTGYGPDDPPNLTFAYTESLYVTLMMRGGLPLLLIYAGLTIALLAAAVRARDDPEPARRVAVRTLVVALVMLVPMHWVEPYFVLTGMGPLLWISAAVALSAQPARARSRVPVPRAPAPAAA